MMPGYCVRSYRPLCSVPGNWRWLFLTTHLSGRVSELESLNLSRRCLRQLRAKTDFAGTLIGDQSSLDVLSNVLRQLRRLFSSSTNHDIGYGMCQPLLCRDTHDCPFGHMRVAEQGILHFSGGDPHPGDFHHVVCASAIMKVPLGVAGELITGYNPIAGTLCPRGQLFLLPVTRERALSLHPQIPDVAR